MDIYIYIDRERERARARDTYISNKCEEHDMIRVCLKLGVPQIYCHFNMTLTDFRCQLSIKTKHYKDGPRGTVIERTKRSASEILQGAI